uniref:CRAL-TRIO domain-containing protein n=1 Tax=Chromera velia CCMP2878 TaxID=1169474 RepID=A0A0G4G2V0_9ALVE|eukprot:Cvel_19914.t1-p1 / transcript=Cvel_19914.t1 / gene=Cvel_19914 / organism=Chromera_velia_CCMP2878 / gene_product=hypothetical protein / transcript_product=hypothetical protein / location=Cvel_scaffold1751:22683-25476(+) / protein_length=484 / sequence_SO=supercontig / SO=protein_coding / is_pseudo=false
MQVLAAFGNFAKIFFSKEADEKLAQLQQKMDEWPDCPEHLKTGADPSKIPKVLEGELRRHLMSRQLDVEVAFEQVKWLYSMKASMDAVCGSSDTPHLEIRRAQAELKDLIFRTPLAAWEAHRKLISGVLTPLGRDFRNDAVLLLKPKFHQPKAFSRETTLRLCALVLLRLLCLEPPTEAEDPEAATSPLPVPPPHAHSSPAVVSHPSGEGGGGEGGTVHGEGGEGTGEPGGGEGEESNAGVSSPSSSSQPRMSFSVVIDFEGWGVSNIERGIGATFSLMAAVLRPKGWGGLRKAYLVNVNMLFRSIWALIKPIIPTAWVEKVEFLSSAADVATLIPPTRLPKRYGGSIPDPPPEAEAPPPVESFCPECCVDAWTEEVETKRDEFVKKMAAAAALAAAQSKGGRTLSPPPSPTPGEGSESGDKEEDSLGQAPRCADGFTSCAGVPFSCPPGWTSKLAKFFWDLQGVEDDFSSLFVRKKISVAMHR